MDCSSKGFTQIYTNILLCTQRAFMPPKKSPQKASTGEWCKGKPISWKGITRFQFVLASQKNYGPTFQREYDTVSGCSKSSVLIEINVM